MILVGDAYTVDHTVGPCGQNYIRTLSCFLNTSREVFIIYWTPFRPLSKYFHHNILSYLTMLGATYQDIITSYLNHIEANLLVKYYRPQPFPYVLFQTGPPNFETMVSEQKIQ